MTRSSARITLAGRNHTQPSHMTDMQRERAEPAFTEAPCSRVGPVQTALTMLIVLAVVIWIAAQ